MAKQWKPGDRFTWTKPGTGGHRNESWPEGAWVRGGETYAGAVKEFHPGEPAVTIGGERFPASRAWCSVVLDNGATLALEPKEMRPE